MQKLTKQQGETLVFHRNTKIDLIIENKQGFKMTLREFIDKNHDGVQYRFAKANKMTPQKVNVMLKHGGYYVFDGELFVVRRKVK